MLRRRLGLALILLGALGAFVFPIWFKTYFNIDLGTYRIYDRQGGFRTIADVSLSPAATPLQITISGQGSMPAEAEGAATTFTMVIDDNDETVAAEMVRISGPVLSGDITANGTITADLALPPVSELDHGRHDFSFRAGESGDIDFAFLDMNLTGNVAVSDPRVPMASYAVLGIGMIILIAPVFRRRKRRDAEPSRPVAEEQGNNAGHRQTSNIGRRVPLDRTPDEPDEQEHRWGRDGADKTG